MGIRNIFEREREKPALLIKDATLTVVQDWDKGDQNDFSAIIVWLVLSQEIDLSPGLILPVGEIGSDNLNFDSSGNATTTLVINDLFKAQGTIWAPRAVGVRVDEINSVSSFQFDVALDYEVIMIPWWDWIILWDFLDNVTDLSMEY